MKRFQVMAAVSLAVGLLISACSQAPVAVKGGLEPQFGSPRDDSADAIATDVQRGRIYLGGSYYGGYNSDDTNRGTVIHFRRYDRGGDLVWKVSANTESPGISADVEDVMVDPIGDVYFGWSTYKLDGIAPYGSSRKGFISKYTSTGKRLFQKRLQDETIRGLATDAAKNFYVTSSSNHVRKYSSNGSLIWDKVLTEKDFQGDSVSIFDIEASADGSLYIGATFDSGFGSLLLKLRSSDGKLMKTVSTKGDAALEVKVSGNSIYVYSYTDGICYNPIVSKFRSDGSEVWARSGTLEEVNDGGTTDYRCDDWSSLGVDNQGNAYLAGYFIDENYDADLYVRKYLPSGEVAFNKQFKSPETYTHGDGVAPIGDNELYVVGSTDGKVNGRNNGGEDAFLLRLNSEGQKVWER